jgi:hypothetical protein
MDIVSTLASLKGYVIISTTGLVILVGTIGIIIFPFFYYDRFPWCDLFFHNLNRSAIV